MAYSSSKHKTIPKLVFMTLALAAQSLAYAGNGTFANGKYAFCASVRFNATADQLARIRTAFANGSQILADATDGQQSFGKIKLVNNSGGSEAAEFWINPQAGRAYATYGHYGLRGEHVNLYYPSNFTGQSGADGDAYTIAHEHAHHSWGVADEYSGPGGNAEDAPASANSMNLNYSLMDNYFTRGGRAFGGPYTLNEFCTAANHDPDHNTWQHSMHGKSVWETIAAHPTRAATAPQGLPVSAPPAPHTVDFAAPGTMQNVMLLLDRSGSMDADGKLTAAKQSAGQYVGIFPDGGNLGVASFSSDGSVDFPLARSDAGAKAAALASINGLVADGNTNIGGGILTALGQLTSQPNRSCEEIIVLLTDGEHNTGTPPEAGIAAAQAEGVTVMTVGLGSQISTAGQTTLQNIATQTGGKFYAVSQPSDLSGVFMLLSAESLGQGLLGRAQGVATPATPAEVPVEVEAGTATTTFALTVPDPQGKLEFSLRTPSGQLLRAADADPAAGLRYTRGDTWQVFQLIAPAPGTWTMIATAGQSGDAKFETTAFAEHDGVQLAAIIEQNSLAYPAPVQIHATPRFEGQNVVGAQVTGTVQRPDGSQVSIELFDDGKAEHGDAIPDDGIYTARFAQYRGDGTYTFQLNVMNDTGKTYAGESMFANQPSNQKDVPRFTRLATVTAVVSGVPREPIVTVDHGPETLNFESEEQFITTYIHIAGGFAAADIDPASVRITQVNGVPIRPLFPIEGSAALVDVDQDGVPELRVRYNRAALQDVLQPGTPEIQVEGTVSGQPFIAIWAPQFVNTGKPAR
jgi:hypothetical protein